MSSKPRKAGNLVALGSAAVVAVYGAGFMRTAAAAERFAEQSDERVLSPDDAAAAQIALKSAAALSGASGATATLPQAQRAVAATAIAPAEVARKADATHAKVDAKVESASAPASKRVAPLPVPPEGTAANSPSSAAPSAPLTVPAVPARGVVPIVAPAVAVMVAPTSVATAPVVIAPVAPATAVTAPVVTAPVMTAPVVPPVAVPVAPNTGEPATVSAGPPKLKDGEYTGYGTSRHGDVEVYLETTDGKITYVKISQCLTQYSCSWISDLPKQVLARQSARVDGVSGATQSANAFYYAVVQALTKAK